MDFLDPKKQKSHRIRLYIGYVLMVIAISLISLLLVFQAYGYNLNFQTGDITQNGLLFVDAHPESAGVYLNNQFKGNTDQRLILPAADYTLQLKRDGYRTWQRSFPLAGGRIERYVYPFLFPEKLVTSESQLYIAPPQFASQSPDRRWLIVTQPNTVLAFALTDLNTNLSNSQPLALPATLFTLTGAKHDIQAVEWSTDNRHLVLKHTFDTGVEFVLIDREVPANSQNLSNIFANTPFTDISLRDKRFDRYYLFNQPAQTLLTADLQAPVVAPALEKVLQFKPHGASTLLYVTTADADAGRVLVKILDNGQTYNLRDFPADSAYLLDIARFANRWYIAAGAVKDQKVYILKDPMAALQRLPGVKLIPATTLRMTGGQYVSFSTNARFVAVQGGNRFAVYDAETDRSYNYSSGLEPNPSQKANWMDGHRLTLVSKGQLYVFDFDGTNQQSLSPAYDALPPFFDSSYSALYVLAPSVVQGRAALVRSELIVKPVGQ